MDLKPLSIEMLEALKEVVNKELEKRYRDKEIEEIIKEVDERGFSCRLGRSLNIEGLISSTLHANIDLYSYDRQNFRDHHVDGMSYDQPSWVEALDFKFLPKGNDLCYTVPDGGGWDYGDWDSPLKAVSKVNVNVYYKLTAFDELLKYKEIVFIDIDSEGSVNNARVNDDDKIVIYDSDAEVMEYDGKDNVLCREDWEGYHYLVIKKI